LEQAAEVARHFAFVVGIARVTANDRFELAPIKPQAMPLGTAVQLDGRVGSDVQLA